MLTFSHFYNWEILTCSGRFYAPTNREKLSESPKLNEIKQQKN
jgi:hypothetical protein